MLCVDKAASASAWGIRMNVLFTVHHRLDPDAGVSGGTLDLGDALRRLGHSVDYFGYDDLPARIGKRVKLAAFPYFVAYHLSRASRRKTIDVVDASTGDAWLWGTLRHSRHGEGPVLVTRSHGLEHIDDKARRSDAARGGLDLSWRYPIYHGGLRLREVTASLRKADLAFFVNPDDREYAVTRLRVDQERAHLYRYGLPRTFIGLEQSDPLGAPVRIAQIGTYIERKGIRYGARALRALLERHPDLRVTFLGTDCPEERVLGDFDAILHNRIQVIPHYSRSDLPSLLGGHHVALLPTLHEGLPLALMEAMACGLAPVSTLVPGPKHLVDDGVDGLLVPPGDSEGLEVAVERLIADPELRSGLAARAYAKVQGFSWERTARETIALYERAVAGRALAGASP